MERRSEVCLIEVDSQLDPDSHMQCCGQETVQAKVGYPITVHGHRFAVSEVWANVC